MHIEALRTLKEGKMLKHMHYKKEYVFPFCFSLLLNFLTANMGSFSLLKRRKNLKDYKVEVGQRGSFGDAGHAVFLMSA